MITIVFPAELRGLARGEEDRHYFDSFLAHCFTDSLVSLDTYYARMIFKLFYEKLGNCCSDCRIARLCLSLLWFLLLLELNGRISVELCACEIA